MMVFWFYITGMALCAAMIGCGGKDLSQTPQAPASPPNIQISDAAFVPESGTVRVRWLQPASNIVQTYALERKLGNDPYEPVMTAGAGALTGEILELRDTLVVAGEQAAYRVAATVGSGEAYYSNTVQVALPGAKLEKVDLKRESATAHLTWRADAEYALRYEVLRQAGDNAPEIVFLSSAPTVTAFVDGPLSGGIPYTYQVRTVLKNGARISSRAVTTGLYVKAKQLQVVSALGQQYRLAVFQIPTDIGKIFGPLVCVFSESDFELYRMWYFDSPPETVRITKGNLPGIRLIPGSVSFTGYEIHNPTHLTESILVGIHPETRALAIQMYSNETTNQWSFNDSPFVWTSSFETWQIGSEYQRTAVARDGNGNVFVVAGGILKVFSVVSKVNTHEATIRESGSIPIPGTGEPGDIVVLDRFVWLSLPDEGRLLKGEAGFTADGALQNIDWQDVSSPDVRPGALTVNARGSVLTLDLPNRKVWMLDSSGRAVTHIDLPETGFENVGRLDGDVVTGWTGSQFVDRDLLYVSNAAGYVALFTTE